MVFDLNNLNAKPMTLIPKFKTKFKKATSIIGFLNHLQGDLKMKAIEAGCDTVMPRSAFSQSLPNLLRRYGLEEEEDIRSAAGVLGAVERAKQRVRRWHLFCFERSFLCESAYPGGQAIGRPPRRWMWRWSTVDRHLLRY